MALENTRRYCHDHSDDENVLQRSTFLIIKFSQKHNNEILEAVTRKCSFKKVFLEISQNSQETPVPEPLLIKRIFNFIKKETLAHVFSYEFCEISKNNFLNEHLRATDSITS